VEALLLKLEAAALAACGEAASSAAAPADGRGEAESRRPAICPATARRAVAAHMRLAKEACRLYEAERRGLLRQLAEARGAAGGASAPAPPPADSDAPAPAAGGGAAPPAAAPAAAGEWEAADRATGEAYLDAEMNPPPAGGGGAKPEPFVAQVGVANPEATEPHAECVSLPACYAPTAAELAASWRRPGAPAGPAARALATLGEMMVLSPALAAAHSGLVVDVLLAAAAVVAAPPAPAAAPPRPPRAPAPRPLAVKHAPSDVVAEAILMAAAQRAASPSPPLAPPAPPPPPRALSVPPAPAPPPAVVREAILVAANLIKERPAASLAVAAALQALLRRGLMAGSSGGGGGGSAPPPPPPPLDPVLLMLAAAHHAQAVLHGRLARDGRTLELLAAGAVGAAAPPEVRGLSGFLIRELLGRAPGSRERLQLAMCLFNGAREDHRAALATELVGCLAARDLASDDLTLPAVEALAAAERPAAETAAAALLAACKPTARAMAALQAVFVQRSQRGAAPFCRAAASSLNIFLSAARTVATAAAAESIVPAGGAASADRVWAPDAKRRRCA